MARVEVLKSLVEPKEKYLYRPALYRDDVKVRGPHDPYCSPYIRNAIRLLFFERSAQFADVPHDKLTVPMIAFITTLVRSFLLWYIHANLVLCSSIFLTHLLQLLYVFTDQTKKFEYSAYSRTYRDFVLRINARLGSDNLNLEALHQEIVAEIEELPGQPDISPLGIEPDPPQPSKVDKDELSDDE